MVAAACRLVEPVRGDRVGDGSLLVPLVMVLFCRDSDVDGIEFRSGAMLAVKAAVDKYLFRTS